MRDLGGIDDRPAADCHQQVGAGIARRRGRTRDILARRMGGDVVHQAGRTLAQCLVQHRAKRHRRGQRTAGDREHPAGAETIGFLPQRLLPGRAEKNAVDAWIMIGPGQHPPAP